MPCTLFRARQLCVVIVALGVVLAPEAVRATGRIINVYPVPLLSAVGKEKADQISKAISDAFERIPGYEARLVDNTPPKTTYGAYVIEGSLNAQTSSAQSTFPKPTGSASADTNEVIITGSVKNIYALNAKEGKAPESTPAYLDVTSQLLPSGNDDEYNLFVYVKQLSPSGSVMPLQSGLLATGTIDTILAALKSADLSPLVAFAGAKSYRRVILLPLVNNLTGADALYINSRLAIKLSNAGVLAIPAASTITFATSMTDVFKECVDSGSDGIFAYTAINDGPRLTLFGFARNSAELGVQYYSCLGQQIWSGSGSGKKTFWESPSQGLSITYQLLHNLYPQFDTFHHIGDALTLFASIGGSASAASATGFSIDYAANASDYQYSAINRAIDDVVDRFCASYLLDPEKYAAFTGTPSPTGSVCNVARKSVLMSSPAPMPTVTPVSARPSPTPVPMPISVWLSKLPSATAGNLFPRAPLLNEPATARYDIDGLPSNGMGVWYDSEHSTVAYREPTSTGDRVVLLERDVPQPNTTPAPSKADLSEVSLNNGVRLGMSLRRAVQEYGRETKPIADKLGYWSLTYPSKPDPGYCAAVNTVVFDSVHGNVVEALGVREFHCTKQRRH